MAWVNVFTLGECNVEVYSYGELMTQQEMDTAGVSIFIDGAGLITLTAPQFTSGGGEYEVRVTPLFDTDGAPVRLTNMAQDLFSNGGGEGFYAAWSPDPVSVWTDAAEFAFTPAGAWTYVSAAVSQMGI